MVRAPKVDKEQEISLFVKTIFFFSVFFLILVMIASFGLIAEA